MYSSPTDLDTFVTKNLKNEGSLRIPFTENGGGWFFINAFFPSNGGHEAIRNETQRRNQALAGSLSQFSRYSR